MMEWHLVLFLSSLMVGFGSPVAEDCPDVCTCKWKGGKQTVECVNASLSAIPSVIDHDTQVLDLAHNYLPLITTDLFKKLRLPHLQKIYLSHCSIHTVEEHSFRGLTNLVDLDLSYNALTDVPTTAVENCKYLMRLSLRANPIKFIRPRAFRGLNELVSLELSECDIESVDEGSFDGLDKLEYLRLDTNRLSTLSPSRSLPPNLRDLTLHRNKWHCDCYLLELHNWLQNFTVPYLVEPKCHSPERLIGRDIKTTDDQEFACIPEVSPTTVYLEVIEGKNMSLVCTIKAIPEASVAWMYKETYVNNGSTLMSDIDMRHYYYIERDIGSGSTRTDLDSFHKKSELFLSATSIDDNGTFACIAKNNAGTAKAEFTLHVVVPVPPKPPQDVVEERFRTEYLIALVVAVGLLLTISLIVVSLLVLRCKRTREKRRRRRNSFGGSSSGAESYSGQERGNSAQTANAALAASSTTAGMMRSRNGECSSTETVDTQMTSSAAGSLVGVSSGGQLHLKQHRVIASHNHHHSLHEASLDPDLIHSLVTEVCVDDEYDEVSDEASDEPRNVTKRTAGDEFRMALLAKSTNCRGSNKVEVIVTENRGHTPRSISFDILRESFSPKLDLPNAQQLSPPTPFADDLSNSTVECNSATLPRPPSRTTSRTTATAVTAATTQQQQRPLSLACSESVKDIQSSEDTSNRRMCRTLPRNCCRTIPPPPQYKGVHFAPGVEQTTGCRVIESEPPGVLSIPTEGLPTGPARSAPAAMIVTSSETVPITLRNGSHPSIPPLPHLAGTPTSSSVTFTTATSSSSSSSSRGGSNRLPPPPLPKKTSTLSSKSASTVAE